MSLFNENTTVEDLLALKKSALQAYLKQKNSGTKLELAQRAFEVNKEDNVCMPTSSVSDAREKGSLSDTESRSNSHVSDTDIISVDSLNSGWTSDTKLFPQISHRDVKQYLIYSSHRTEDSGKMECYRQFIRGFNFYKEGYIHNTMVNLIEKDSKMCYIRSKCYPSMKQGTYTQWVCLSKEAPYTILKAYCSCPAG
ncbi:LOW QUALITY PROTEIN: hypothetical protein KUTeg_022206 [Tegillarca granosa]|uniref:Uncharacterized protein n=1 Tax=Tegillarca granosa TaxID=220873 RepID=A0ABQ9EAV1_TEGGR|nr:LOW QUALITY PROTEIN: hypothetical protein KUTeg_022206 [Tegillarca granosa]